MTPTVLKLGGELIEDVSHLQTVVSALAAGHRHQPLVIVHGGGREIDAALRKAGIAPRQVDGLRITDQATLDVVVAVLAGTVNTRLVAALVTSGVRAVGLTGADARCGLSARSAAHRAADGSIADLGHVGVPVAREVERVVAQEDVDLLEVLIDAGFVPVVACIGIDEAGRLLNVNADTLAGHLGARLGAGRVVICGTTPGVLDENGATLPVLDSSDIPALVASRTATAGMIAKLRACELALSGGAGEVLIVDGRDRTEIEAAVRGQTPKRATRLTRQVSRVGAGC